MPTLQPVEGDPFLQPVKGDPFAEGMTLTGNVAQVAKKLETDEAARRQKLQSMVESGPGHVAAPNPYPPGSEEWEFYEQSRQSNISASGARAALNTIGRGVPMAQPGSLGATGGGIKVFHGSPHDYNAERLIRHPSGETEYIVGTPNALPDVPAGAEVLKDYPLGRVRIDKVGTGEGAQVYGHGWYGAENPQVAAEYAKKLGGGNVDNVKPDEEAIAAIKPKWDEIVTKLQAAREKSGGRMTDETAALQNHLDALNDHAVSDTLSRKPWLTEGRRYEVNINADPEHFLDWDKPLSEQHKSVKDKLSAIGFNLEKGGGDSQRTPATLLGIKGSEGAERFQKAGIPGIRYLDQGSRMTAGVDKLGDNYFVKGSVTPYKTRAEAETAAKASGAATHNYVVFHHSIVDILKKYGLAGLIAGGAAHFKTQPHEGDPFADSQ